MRWATRRPTTARGIRRRSLDHPPLACRRTARARSRAAACASCGAPSTCSASILRASTCARTPTCIERVIAELFEKAHPRHGLLAACRRTSASPCSLEELRTPRPLASPYLDIFRRNRIRTRHRPRGRARRTAATGAAAVPNYVISKASDPSDILEVALLLKEAGLLRPREGEMDVNIVPLFETIADLRNARAVMDELFALPDTCALSAQPRPGAGGDARLFRQQQGRRLSHLRAGSSTRPRSSSIEVFQRAWRCAAPLSRPRRLRRPRRRAELSGDPRPAGRCRAGRDPHHRAGRGDRGKYSNPELGRRNLEILAAATLEATLLHSAGGGAARGISRRHGGAFATTPSRPIAASSTRRRASSAISGNRR